MGKVHTKSVPKNTSLCQGKVALKTIVLPNLDITEKREGQRQCRIGPGEDLDIVLLLRNT